MAACLVARTARRALPLCSGICYSPSHLTTLVAPALAFHSTAATILRYFSPEIDVERVGINSDWSAKLKVILRLKKGEPNRIEGKYERPRLTRNQKSDNEPESRSRPPLRSVPCASPFVLPIRSVTPPSKHSCWGSGARKTPRINGKLHPGFQPGQLSYDLAITIATHRRPGWIRFPRRECGRLLRHVLKVHPDLGVPLARSFPPFAGRTSKILFGRPARKYYVLPGNRLPDVIPSLLSCPGPSRSSQRIRHF